MFLSLATAHRKPQRTHASGQHKPFAIIPVLTDMSQSLPADPKALVELGTFLFVVRSRGLATMDSMTI